MRVTVGDHELNGIRRSTVPRQPRPNERVDWRRNVYPLGASVEQQCPIATEHQVEERLFEVGARRLAEDEQVRVVLMDLERRRSAALRAAGIEGCWQASRFDYRGRRPATAARADGANGCGRHQQAKPRA